MSASAALRLDRPAAAPAPAGPAVVLPFPQLKAPEPEMSAIERQVVWLSRTDPSPRGRVATVLLRMLGVRAAGQRLADPKLEALRRFAVTVRTSSGRPAHSDVERFRAAGYDETLLFSIFDLVADAGRTPERSARFWRLMVTFAVLFGFLPPVAIALTDYFDDPRLGVLGTAMIFATAIPVLARLTAAAGRSRR